MIPLGSTKSENQRMETKINLLTGIQTAPVTWDLGRNDLFP